MQEVTIYTTNVCLYCVKAKDLLKRKNVQYKEINVEETAARQEMMNKTNGKRSVPQIFIGQVHVGGCDDLYALEAKGELDTLLS